MKDNRRAFIKQVEDVLAVNTKLVIKLLILGTVLFVNDLVTPYFYQIFVDQVLLEKQWSIFLWIICGYLISLLVKQYGKIRKRKIENEFVYPMLGTLRKRILENELKKPMCTIRNSLGDKKVRMNEDADTVIQLYLKQKSSVPIHLATAILAFLCMLFREWHMSIIAIISIPITVWLDAWLSKKESRLNAFNRENMAAKEQWLKEDIRSFQEKKLWQLEGYGIKRFAHFQNLYTQYNSRWINYWTARILVIPEMKNEFVMKLGVYFIGGTLIAKGKMTVGSLLVFITYYQLFIGALQNISNDRAEIIEAKPSIHHVFDQLSFCDSERVCEKIKVGKISWSDLMFCYPGHEEKQITIPKGAVSAGKLNLIQGSSGCGKTSLYRMLLQYYHPQKGSIQVVNSEQMKELQETEMLPYDWYEKVSCVMQDSILFSGSIKENLKYANPEAAEDQMLHVCNMAGLDTFLKQSDQGLDTEIGYNGNRLSGGQRQRLLLARALLKESEVLLLDEVTSALDESMEKRIVNQLKEIAKTKLVVLISHTQSEYQNTHVICLKEG